MKTRPSIFYSLFAAFFMLVFSSCASTQPSSPSPDVLQQIAAQAALNSAATPFQDLLVWTVGPNNALSTHWVRGNHASAIIVASRSGLLFPVDSELWELREVDVEIPLCDCELWDKRKLAGECPPAEEVANASLPIMVNLITGDQIELQPYPAIQNEKSLVDRQLSITVSVTGSIGSYLFISQSVERTPCGDSRVKSNSTFRVFDLENKRSVSLFRPQERQRVFENEQKVAYAQFRTDPSIPLESPEDLQFSRIEIGFVPGVGLALGYRFTVQAFFADSKGNQSTYERSITVPAKTLPHALVPFAEFPSGLHRLVVLSDEIRIGGWSTLTRDEIESLRIHDAFDVANNTN